MNFGIIIQARLGSSRMPNKVFKKIEGELNLLDILHGNLSILDIPIVFAIPTSKNDDILFKYLTLKKYLVYRGSENNVLQRTIEAAKTKKIDFVVRVCSDNLFIQALLLKEMMSKTKKTDDYVSFYLDDDTPTILTHFGFFGEIVKLETLENISKTVEDNLYLEHVTNYIHRNPNKFNINKLRLSKKLNELKNKIRLTIDTPEDFEIAKTIYSKINKQTNVNEILEAVMANKEYQLSMQKRIKEYTK